LAQLPANSNDGKPLASNERVIPRLYGASDGRPGAPRTAVPIDKAWTRSYLSAIPPARLGGYFASADSALKSAGFHARDVSGRVRRRDARHE